MRTHAHGGWTSILGQAVIVWAFVSWERPTWGGEEGGGKSPSLTTEASLFKTALFAGGCFWCMEEAFEGQEGVVSVQSGYTGGHLAHPTYKQVTAGNTGHAESIQILYDPQKTTYERLLDIFWHNVDPTVKDRQFCDDGHQYRTALFYNSEEQQRLAETSKAFWNRQPPFDGKIATEIVPAQTFYEAEAYHQDFYRKNPIRYRFYKFNCGRAQRLKEIWGKSEPPNTQNK